MENIQENLSEPMGYLFDSIAYYNIEDLEKFVTNMNPDQALYCVIQAAKSAYNKNIFELEESEVLSKAIRKLSIPNVVEDAPVEENN